MRWFKAVTPDMPQVAPILEAFGFEGYGKFLAVLAYCQEFQTLDVTPELIVLALRGRQINRRSAAKLSPMFRECLVKLSPMFGKTFPNVSPKFDQSLTKLEAQNPHGPNNNIKQIEIEEEKKETVSRAHEEKISEAPRRSPEVVKALEYLAKADHPNFCNLAWVPGYLENQFDRLAQERPDMPRQAALQCWLEACDIALAKGNSSPAWMRSVFDRLVTEWTAAKPVTNPQAQRGQMERLAEALESGLRIYNTAREWESFGREEVQLIAPDLVLVSGTERPQSATMFKIRGPDDA